MERYWMYGAAVLKIPQIARIVFLSAREQSM